MYIREGYIENKEFVEQIAQTESKNVELAYSGAIIIDRKSVV